MCMNRKTFHHYMNRKTFKHVDESEDIQALHEPEDIQACTQIRMFSRQNRTYRIIDNNTQVLHFELFIYLSETLANVSEMY